MPLLLKNLMQTRKYSYRGGETPPLLEYIYKHYLSGMRLTYKIYKEPSTQEPQMFPKNNLKK